ncbi:hypothetical protein [Dasineura jujubifolia toursvirus 2a]|nr:hypothetical protein [Dasineura jujubifolia toursvirus 2a]
MMNRKITNFDPRAEAKPITNTINPAAHVPSHKFNLTQESDDMKVKVSIYRRTPWMKETVDAILVHPIAMPIQYYDPSSGKEGPNGDMFYRVKSLYYKMRSNGNIINTDEGIITIIFNDEVIKFKVGYIVRNINYIVVQNEKMLRDEQSYIDNINNSNLNITQLKAASVSNDLRNIAIAALSEFTPDLKYSSTIVSSVENSAVNAYDFAYKICKITTCAKLNTVLKTRLKKGYYNEEVIHLMSYDTLLGDLNYDIEEVKNYVEDAALNMILYAFKYSDIPTRKYTRTEYRLPKQKIVGREVDRIQKLDVRLRCHNFDDVKTIEDENLVFYEEGGRNYCFDVIYLYMQFSDQNPEGPNYKNDYTGIDFNPEFVDKIKTMYKFKFQNMTTELANSKISNDSINYDEIVNTINNLKTTEFQDILKTVLHEVDMLGNNKNDKKKECAKCKRYVGIMGLSTLTNSGSIKNYCSDECFL